MNTPLLISAALIAALLAFLATMPNNNLDTLYSSPLEIALNQTFVEQTQTASTQSAKPTVKSQAPSDPGAKAPDWNAKCAFAASKYPDGNMFIWNSNECQTWYTDMGVDGKGKINE